jgi:hypothetical protein
VTEPDQQATRADTGLLRNTRFVRYSYAKFLSLLGQNALIYGLFIAVISEQESALATSGFVLASVIPSIMLSLPGGLVADLFPKKLVLLIALALRMLVVFWFVDFNPGPEAVIGLTFLVWTAYQFFSPAENAAIPAIIAREKLPHASSFLQALSLVAQLTGAGVVAPLAVKFLDREGLYIIVLVALTGSALLFLSIQGMTDTTGPRPVRTVSWWRALPVGFRTIRGDVRLFSITLMRILLDTGMLMFVVTAPIFIEDILNTSATNAIYIALPGAIGLALGLVSAPLILTMVNARAVALFGFICFTSVLLALPHVDRYAPHLAGASGPLGDITRWLGVSDAIVATMLLLPIAGLGSSFVQVAARTEVYRRTPSHLIAQVFATQSAMGSISALIPTFLAGVMLDLLPVRVVLILIGLSLTVCALAAWSRGAMGGTAPRPVTAAPPTPATDPEDWA